MGLVKRFALQTAALGIVVLCCCTSRLIAQVAFPQASSQHLSKSEQLDINSATIAELQSLPGMGAAYARRVVEGRPYSAKNQLVTRGVLPQTTYDGIRDRIVAHRVQSPR